MFTNNYIAFRHNAFWAAATNMGLSFGGSKIVGKSMTSAFGTSCGLDTSPDIWDSDIGSNLNGQCKALLTASATSASKANPGIYFGSGTTPATKDDYTLESPISSGLTIVSASAFVENTANGQYCISRDYVLTNTTDANITVSEIGCFVPIVYDTDEWYQVLMERTVFPSPVTIQPGESKLITYKITFNQSQ